jgi:DNA-binding NarL/FixJ family response regulator
MPDSLTRIRVLLAEDHETVREGLRALLAREHDIDLVGEARDGRAAIDVATALKPQVVVMDLSMPDVNGLTATRTLKEAAPGIAVVALTRHDDEAYLKALLGAGASGYVLKQSPFKELLRAIRAAAAGERYLDPALASRDRDLYPRRRLPAVPVATERESQVLRLMAVGHSNKEIADQMGITVKTVEVHKANAMRKLGLRGRIDVVRYAVLHGWLQEP